MDGRAQGVSPRLAYAGDAGNGLAADRTSVRSSRGEIIGAAAHTTRDQCFAARVDRAPNPEQRPPEFDSGRPWNSVEFTADGIGCSRASVNDGQASASSRKERDG